MRRNAKVFLALLLGVWGNAAMAMPVYQDSSGREWLDLNETRSRSWINAAAVCDANSGSCSGTLANTGSFTHDLDVTGYQWASRDEVRDLFYEVAGLPQGSLDSFSAAFSSGNGYGANVFGKFDPTIQFQIGPSIANVLNGITRDLYSGLVFNTPLGLDTFTLAGQTPQDLRDISMGVYLYKTVAVPEPGTFALFGAGLFAVFAMSRRRLRSAR
jgi:hypothetical protein